MRTPLKLAVGLLIAACAVPAVAAESGSAYRDILTRFRTECPEYMSRPDKGVIESVIKTKAIARTTDKDYELIVRAAIIPKNMKFEVVDGKFRCQK